jgi:hypothetical protein
LKLSPSPKPQLDQPAHGSLAANIHAFGRRFKLASINRPIASDRVTPALTAHASSAAITSPGTRPEMTGSRPVAGRPIFRFATAPLFLADIR